MACPFAKSTGQDDESTSLFSIEKSHIVKETTLQKRSTYYAVMESAILYGSTAWHSSPENKISFKVCHPK